MEMNQRSMKSLILFEVVVDVTKLEKEGVLSDLLYTDN